MKDLISESIELTYPDVNKQFTLETDASDFAVGAVLKQEFDGKMKIVGVASRKLNEHEVNYPTHEKELLAIVWGCQ